MRGPAVIAHPLRTGSVGTAAVTKTGEYGHVSTPPPKFGRGQIAPRGLQEVFMPQLIELKQQYAFALNKAESIIQAAEAAGRDLTETENNEYHTAMAAVSALKPQIAKVERNNSIRQHLVEGKLIAAAGNLRQARTPNAPVVLSEDYYNDFHTWIGSRGQQIGASLYEGAGSAGGFTVPVIVEGQVVPLAPTEMGVMSIATVVPTASDIKIPRQTAYSTAAGKAESGGGADNFFADSDPTLDQLTL